MINLLLSVKPHSAPISPVLSRVERSSSAAFSTRYCLTYWMGVMPSICRKLRSVQSLDEASASALLEIDDMNELPKALSETSETSGKVGEY